MQHVQLKPFYYRGIDNIGIYAANFPEVNRAIRKLPAVKWSQFHKVWYLPLYKTTYQNLLDSLKTIATIDDSAVRQFLFNKTKDNAAKTPIRPPVQTGKPATRAATRNITPENLFELNRYEVHLKLKAYSHSTIRTYRNEFMQLLQLLKKKAVHQLSPEDLKRYMIYAIEKQGIKENTAHSRLNALKFYFEQVLGKEKFFWDIPRPKKPLILPKVLGETELSRLFNASGNLKHKAILFTAYSAGLRVSEVTNLQWKHIDRSRGQVLIEQAKGKKDRYVTLSPVLEDILISYYKNCKEKPVKYVFESTTPGQPYSVRSAQAIFQQAKLKAGIKKETGFHSLRHSFATHLLEKGTDVRFIQELLGHFSIKTTTRYLHVAKEMLVVIESPLDSLWKKGGIDWDG